MSDIVEQLRRKNQISCDADDDERMACRGGICKCDTKVALKAADEIERLREALLEIQKRAEQQSTMPFDRHADYFRMARAALGEGEDA
jgi:hypothetical protein